MTPRKSPRVELICVGSELLAGKPSVHGAYFAGLLAGLGLELSRETVVGDEPEEMRRVFSDAWKRAEIVICTGGLGPTFDDLTRDVWSRTLKLRLRYFPRLAADIEGKFRRRGLRMPRENLRQAYVLSGACVMDNRIGTAPGQLLATRGKVLALFPGPRRELAPMAEETFVPFLKKNLDPTPRASRSWRLFGKPESVIDERLDSIRRAVKSGRSLRITWGILAQKGVIDIKAAVAGPDRRTVDLKMDQIDRRIRRRFGRDIFGREEDSLEAVVGRLLRARRAVVATAESCTGGLIAESLTRVAGSSDYFRQGYVVYSNESKERLLGVKPATLRRHGAVSETCAAEMARGCRRRSRTDYALAVTGIAGPGGGSPEKPVGLVYLALAGPRKVRVRRHVFSGDREQIRQRTCLAALDWLRREIVNS